MNLMIFLNVAGITKALFPHDIVFKRCIYFYVCGCMYVCAAHGYGAHG